MSLFVDSHVHFWNPALREHGWLRGEPRLNRPYEVADIEFGQARAPDGLVFVEADCRPDQNLDEAHWASGFALGAPPVVGVVAHAPLDCGNAVEGQLEALAQLPLVVGVRRLLQDEPRETFESDDLAEGLRLLPRFGFTFDACVRHDQLASLARLAAECPDTQFILDHLGKPPITSGDGGAWHHAVQTLAARPNVACKLSGLTTEVGPSWSSRELQPYLAGAIEAFGPERCMYGSDWPVALLATTYERWLETVIEATSGLSTTERAWIAGLTATRIYGLQLGRTDEREQNAGS